MCRVREEQLAALDAFIESEAASITRPQAIRAILDDWLRTHGFGPESGPKPTGPATEAVEAMDAAIKEHRGSKQKR